MKTKKFDTIILRWMLSLICIIAVSTFSFAQRGSVSHRIVIENSNASLQDTIAPDGSLWTTVHYANLENGGHPGEVSQPYVSVSFLVPTYSINYHVSVSDEVVSCKMSTFNPLFPVQEPQTINNFNPSKFTQPQDGYIELCSSPRAEYDGEQFLDGDNHVVTVTVYPMSCLSIGDIQEVSLYKELTVTLDYEKCAPKEMSRYSPKINRNAEKGFDLAEYVVNPQDAVSFTASFSNKKSRIVTQSGSDSQMSYLIIAPENLCDALGDLARWKSQKGYLVNVISIESILSNPEYSVGSSSNIVDEAAALREFLVQYTDQMSVPPYCLLVGDYRTSMPIRKAYRTLSAANAAKYEKLCGETYMPTDNYFSDLTTQFDLTPLPSIDNPLIYSYKYDKFPYSSSDVYIGRLLCHTEQEIKTYTDKLILYESNPGYGDNEYLSHAMGFEHNDMYSANYYSTIMGELFNNGLYNDNIVLSDYGRNHPKGEDIIREMNKSGFSVWNGHGNPGSVTTSKEFYSSVPTPYYIKGMNYHTKSQIGMEGGRNNGINNLTNFSKPSVALSIACINAPFDCFAWDDEGGTVFNLDYTIAGAFTVGGYYGGVALIANTRSSLVSTAHDMAKSFTNQIQKFRHIGIAESKAKLSYSSNSKWETTINHLIGEPEFEMWLEQPKTLDVIMKIGKSNIVLTGKDIDGCKVVIYDGISSSKSYDCVGNVSRLFSYPDTSDHAVIVSVWKTGYLPIISTNCTNQKITNKEKSFIVRDAVFGQQFSHSDFEIGANARLDVKAIDSIVCNDGFTVSAKGKVYFESDNYVNMNGGSLHNEGELTIEAKRIVLNAGFHVEQGATLIVK